MPFSITLFQMFWKKHPYQRKYKFIDKKQQVRFAVDVVLHSLLFPIFMLLLMILPPFSSWLLRGDEAAIKPILLDFYRVVVDHLYVVIVPLLFIGVFSVLFSHRIFGPMRRFENALLKRKENPDQPVRCNLRGGDYFHDFSKLLEEVVNSPYTPAGTAGKAEESTERVDKV